MALHVWSRKVVGWSMASHLRTEFVLDALEMAVSSNAAPGVGDQHKVVPVIDKRSNSPVPDGS
jgi:transposase InsO family protein